MPKEPYTIRKISPGTKDLLLNSIMEDYRYVRKADLAGICVELITDDEDFCSMWIESFSPMSNSVRPHCRVVNVKSKDYGKLAVFFEPLSKTVFAFNNDYYGYTKSLALAAAGDFLEEYHSIHSRFSVHGSCVDFKGRGVALVAPSGTGKTTLSYGLLLKENAKLVADDWFYVMMTKTDAVAYASEKSSYIRDDIGKTWGIYKKLVTDTKLDTHQRGVVNIERAIGFHRTKLNTTLNTIIILKRDAKGEAGISKLSVRDAVNYLVKNDFCNPHQLVRNERKKRLRKNFFRKLFSKVDLYMLNTAHDTPEASLKKIADIVAD